MDNVDKDVLRHNIIGIMSRTEDEDDDHMSEMKNMLNQYKLPIISSSSFSDEEELCCHNQYWWIVNKKNDIITVTLLYDGRPVFCVIHFIRYKTIIYAEVSHTSVFLKFSIQFHNIICVNGVNLHIPKPPTTDRYLSVLAQPSVVKHRKIDIVKMIQPESSTVFKIEAEVDWSFMLFRLAKGSAEVAIIADDTEIYEWDIAAGHALLLATTHGSMMFAEHGKEEFVYGNTYNTKWKIPSELVACR